MRIVGIVPYMYRVRVTVYFVTAKVDWFNLLAVYLHLLDQYTEVHTKCFSYRVNGKNSEPECKILHSGSHVCHRSLMTGVRLVFLLRKYSNVSYH